jgi:hypothetical protein
MKADRPLAYVDPNSVTSNENPLGPFSTAAPARLASIRLLLRGLSPLIAVAAVDRARGGQRLERELFDRLSALSALQVVDPDVVYLATV